MYGFLVCDAFAIRIHRMLPCASPYLSDFSLFFACSLLIDPKVIALKVNI